METTAFTINFNTNKVDEITARRVIAARAALAEAKAEILAQAKSASPKAQAWRCRS